jgi:hypothetical protein
MRADFAPWRLITSSRVRSTDRYEWHAIQTSCLLIDHVMRLGNSSHHLMHDQAANMYGVPFRLFAHRLSMQCCRRYATSHQIALSSSRKVFKAVAEKILTSGLCSYDQCLGTQPLYNSSDSADHPTSRHWHNDRIKIFDLRLQPASTQNQARCSQAHSINRDLIFAELVVVCVIRCASNPV